MKFRLRLTCWIVLFSFCFSILGCGGGGGGGSYVGPETTQTFALAKASALAPYEMATINVTGHIPALASYSAVIGETSLDLVKVESQLMLMVPPLANGVHRLQADIDGLPLSLDFEVKEIADAQTKGDFTTNMASFKAEIDEIYKDAIGDNADQYNVVKNYINDLQTQYSKLSTEAMAIVNNFIAANPFETETQANIRGSGYDKGRSDLRADQNMIDQANSLRLSVIALGIGVGLTSKNVVLCIFLSDLAWGLGAQGKAASAVLLGLAVGHFLLQIARLEVVMMEFDKLWLIINDKLDFAVNLRLSSGTGPISFESNKSKSVSFEVEMAKIGSAGRSTGISLIQEIISALDGIYDSYLKVKSVLPGSSKAPKKVEDLPKSSTNKQKLPGKYLSFVSGSLSNSKVKLEKYEAAGESINLTFSTEEKSTQNFTFSVKATIPDYFEATKTLSGTIEGTGEVFSITVPTMQTVVIGETLNLSAIEIFANFSDGSSAVITDKSKLSWSYVSGDGSVSGNIYIAPTEMPSDLQGAILKCSYIENQRTLESFMIIDLKEKYNDESGIRFTMDAEGIITDSKTGLQWYLGESGLRSWYQWHDYASDLEIGNGGWRMPTMYELRPLYPEAWPSGLFQVNFVWSSDQGPESDYARYGDHSTALTFSIINGSESLALCADKHFGTFRTLLVRSRR